jgi:hypothetical protein
MKEGSILDAVSEHAHEDIKAIKCERWEYPRRSVDRMIAYCNEEGHKCEDTVVEAD